MALRGVAREEGLSMGRESTQRLLERFRICMRSDCKDVCVGGVKDDAGLGACAGARTSTYEGEQTDVHTCTVCIMRMYVDSGFARLITIV